MSDQRGTGDADRRLRARAAAHESWARTIDRRVRTANATQAMLERFEREVDPEGQLPPDLRRELAVHARTAHMLRLARRSAAVRRRAPRRYDTEPR
ncbi:hypothetical protein ABZ816_35805 [Actinosynnema sp. NPDC047251]|uniref:Uncharacterized protein n=1 Tax=Saccharothrix espanaensis (strain ATCC 51144 / DSM 44229 / JCM 9112 / NBRC 15066 / NRRL 15764) TaxID=1179773 RepID=K0JYN7_SACES|nr:hypothetical protein [Saccharothrix espanaensis]CCH29343.1 hypothetical protein BN6_20210 [Saccharothrix espanaensis DSM 44229]